jgi:hypothetical protein
MFLRKFGRLRLLQHPRHSSSKLIPEAVVDISVDPDSDMHSFHKYDKTPLEPPFAIEDVVAFPYTKSPFLERLELCEQELIRLKTEISEIKPLAIANAVLLASQVCRDLEFPVLMEFFANNKYFIYRLNEKQRTSILAVRDAAKALKGKVKLDPAETEFLHDWNRLCAEYDEESINALASLRFERNYHGHPNWEKTEAAVLIESFEKNLVIDRNHKLSEKVNVLLRKIISKHHIK